jgi:hypothetical protein
MAIAVGEDELEALVAHFTDRSQWVEAAKAKWAVYFVSSGQTVVVMDEVMELLEKCGPTRTSGALQLEIDVIGSVKYSHRSKYASGSEAKTQLGARIAELGQNPLVRTDPWKLVLGGVYPKLVVIAGVVPFLWENGKRVDGESVYKGISLWYNQGMPLMQSGCDAAVGARKVMMILPSCIFYNSQRDIDTHALF